MAARGRMDGDDGCTREEQPGMVAARGTAAGMVAARGTSGRGWWLQPAARGTSGPGWPQVGGYSGEEEMATSDWWRAAFSPSRLVVDFARRPRVPGPA